MLKKVRKDKNLRTNYYNEQDLLILKSISKNNNLSKIIQWNALEKLQNSNTNCKTKFINRCVYTGRSKKINKYFKFSRLSLLRFIRNGLIPGIIKSSW